MSAAPRRASGRSTLEGCLWIQLASARSLHLRHECGELLAVGETIILLTLPLIHVETLAKGKEGCSRMTGSGRLGAAGAQRRGARPEHVLSDGCAVGKVCHGMFDVRVPQLHLNCDTHAY